MGIIATIPGILGHLGIIIIGKMPPFPASAYFPNFPYFPIYFKLYYLGVPFLSGISPVFIIDNFNLPGNNFELVFCFTMVCLRRDLSLSSSLNLRRDLAREWESYPPFPGFRDIRES